MSPTNGWVVVVEVYDDEDDCSYVTAIYGPFTENNAAAEFAAEEHARRNGPPEDGSSYNTTVEPLQRPLEARTV